MALTAPAFIPQPWAASGQAAAIPDQKPEFGRASWSQGFPTETSIPLNAGGIPPNYLDFQGVLKTLSQFAFFQQSGGLFAWSASLDYLKGTHILGRDGAEYVALAPSGPEAPGSGGGFVGPVDPVGGADGYWLAVSGLSWTAASTYPSPCLRLHGGKVWLWLSPSGPGIPGVGSKEPGADGSAGYWSEFSAGGGGGGETPPPGYLSEFRSFFEQTVPKGWAVRNGAVLANASATVPKLLTYLQQPENAWKCKSLEQWNALSAAAGGVGGVPFFVVDAAANTIKLPDTRGDYERGAGSSYLETVGAWHPDAIRNLTGTVDNLLGAYGSVRHGVLMRAQTGIWNLSGGGAAAWNALTINSADQIPTAAENRTRAFGMLPCVYVGTPT